VIAGVPAVSVVIPTRDRWPLLARTALAAVLRQDGVDLEVVVVDDGSAEGPPPSLAGLDDPRVRLVRQRESRGVAAARNAGIREARGKWVAFLDDDDVWSPTKLRDQIAAATAARAGFVYAGAVWVDEQLELAEGHAPPSPDTLARELLRWNVLWGGSSNVVARRELVESLGGFDERLHQLADWDLWIRLALAAPCAAVDDVLVALSKHEQSMLLVDRRDVFVEFAYLREKHSEHARRAGVRPDTAAFARWVAGGHLRAGRRRAAARAYVHGTASPGNLLRAVGALLGPWLLISASRLRSVVPGALPEGQRVAERPVWLDLYR
jgi:glycosyltransferase involved in cell wall biosynthesis